ncbi:MAG: rane fusion protein multidrug efflux system [Rhodospirillaceae bacterium]|nr:rane fusion protein multidrug efflux system [Rhodospirillaceae bacterium]
MRSLRMDVGSTPTRLLATLCVTLALLAGCDQKQQAQAPAPPPPAVGVQPAAMRGVARAYEFVGRIKAVNMVAIRARVEGFLEKILFREGQDVKTGDLLYQIEKTQYQAQVDQANANLAAAQAQAVNAELQYNRTLELAKKQFTPQATVDQNRAAVETARAKVLQMRAALTQAELNLSYTDIKSPIDGRIGLTAYTQGNLVNPASGVLTTIVSQDPMYVLFPVSVRQLQEIRESRRQQDGRLTKIAILVRLSTGKEYPHSGVWNYTDPQVDQQTDTLTMRGTLPNPDRMLADGEFVTVVVRERKEQPRLVVSQAAVQIDQAGSYVLVVNADNKVELRRVTVGPTQDADVVIESGLKEGDRVIVDGVQKVRPGQAVKVTVVASGKGT